MSPKRADGEQVSTLGSSTLKETSVGVEFSMDLSRLLPVRSCAFLGCGLHSSHLGSSSCSGASPFYASSRAASDLLQYSGNPSFRYNIRHGSLSSQVVINRRQCAGAQLEERVCKLPVQAAAIISMNYCLCLVAVLFTFPAIDRCQTET